MPKPSRKSIVEPHLCIGITIGLHDPAESLWINGIKQNAIYLAEALRHCPAVRTVYLVNTTAVAITDQLKWDQQRWPVMTFSEAKDQVDVLIELGGQVSADETSYLKDRGARLVSYCCGVEYITTMESILFDRPAWGYNLFVNQRYDDIWMVPQIESNSRSYFETLRRRDARPVPFVWDPILLTTQTQDMSEHGCYLPQQGAKRLSVMEPNHDIVKFCMYPIFIAEQAYRIVPDRIAGLHVTNSERLAKHNKEFIAVMNQLDIVREHKALFLGRYDTPYFLKTMTDIVVSHQLENPLNYFYFDVCWQGYPLVHNASLCSDLGYYYEGNDTSKGAQVLQDVLAHHDDDWEAYQARQRKNLRRYIPGHADITKQYQLLLDNLMSKAPI